MLKNAFEIAREYFPNESEDFIEGMIWNETGYPHFFQGDPEQRFRLQLATAACRELYGEYGYWDNWKSTKYILADARKRESNHATDSKSPHHEAA